ncbi:MAG: transglycosylase SLT domain-containing protein [Elusimicrobiota bacterium]
MSTLLLFVGVAAILALALQRQEAQATPTAPDAAQPPPPSPFYAAGRLNAKQRDAADLIIQAAQAAGVNAAFMLALAVTESSLRPDITGDDRKSIGLFHLQVATARDYEPTITTGELFDATINARIAMKHLQSLVRQFPRGTAADYTQAWALGGPGHFVKGRTLPAKVNALDRAIQDLNLDLSINEVIG